MKKKLMLHKETLKNLGEAGGTFLPPSETCTPAFESPTAGFTTLCTNVCL